LRATRKKIEFAYNHPFTRGKNKILSLETLVKDQGDPQNCGIC